MARWLPCAKAIVGTTIVLVAAVGSASAGGTDGIPGRSISTTGPVLALAADGTTVAAVIGSKTSVCGEQVVIWDTRREAPTVMRRKSECRPSELADGGLAIAVGGRMVGAIRFSSDHAVESMLSVTRIPTNGRWTDITGVYDYEYGAGEGDYLSVLGDGPILAFDKWTLCYVYDAGDTCPGVSKGGGWWVSNGQLVQVRPPGSKGPLVPCPRLSGEDNGMGIPWGLAVVKACRRIGSGASFVRAVSLDRGRFLTLPPKGRVTIVDANSGDVTELPIQTSSVRQADLDGTSVVILPRGRAGIPVLEVRDASTGALRRTWPLSRLPIKASSIELEDAHSGIAVYRIGTTIHLLRITDGKSHTIPIPTNEGPVHSRLEDAGLTYSYNNIKGAESRGRIEFVSAAQLVAQLR